MRSSLSTLVHRVRLDGHSLQISVRQRPQMSTLIAVSSAVKDVHGRVVESPLRLYVLQRRAPLRS
jgi:hypothetical protein